MRLQELDLRRWIAERTAKFMFSLSLAFLLGQAVLVVLWADVPMLVENTLGSDGSTTIKALRLQSSLSEPVAERGFLALKLIWPIFIAEALFHWFSRPWDRLHRKYHFFELLFCLCPSLRMCARSPEMGSRIWLPGLGWRMPNKRLRLRLERNFSVPMIMIALLIMPVLIVEFFMKDHVSQHAWLRLTLHVSTGLIWFAFAGEFILMFSVAKKKLDYCKDHWIDLAIILLPFISFLRSLRILRASRAAKLVRVSQITKFARVYRLRGTAVKALRALILLELFQRVMGGPERSIQRLQKRLNDIETEAKHLRRKITRLQLRQREQQVEQSGDDSDVGDLPLDAEQEAVSKPQVADSSDQDDDSKAEPMPQLTPNMFD